MRLKDRNLSPVGGFFFDYQTSDGGNHRVKTDGNFERLVKNVRKDMQLNHYEIPGNLLEMVEDQICMRQPAGRCWYTEGLGDQASKVIHNVARIADNLAAKVGLKPKLEKRARGCGGCGKRRVQMNKVKVS